MRSPRLLLTSLAPVALAAGLTAGCGPAPAGTVADDGNRVTYTAADGVANDLVVFRNLEGEVLLSDAAGSISTPASCAPVDDRTVRCPSRLYFTFLGRDGNDRLFLRTAFAEVSAHGGVGDDTLAGGPGNDRLIGDEGSDFLAGGGGSDILDEGSTVSSTDAVDRDELSGGPNDDTVRYARASLPVHLDLDGARDDGRPGEGDLIQSDVEHLTAGSGADVVIGDGKATNRLDGGGGGDGIRGGDGIDLIDGGGGNDSLFGEVGDDELHGGTGFDLLSGGAGTDSCHVESDGGTVSECEA